MEIMKIDIKKAKIAGTDGEFTNKECLKYLLLKKDSKQKVE